MKISLQELRAFEDFIQRLEDETERRYVDKDGEEIGWSYYADRPHLIMLMGFDEYVSFRNKKQYQDFWFSEYVEDCGQSIYRKPSGQWLLMFLYPSSRHGRFLFHNKQSFERSEERDNYSLADDFGLEISLRELFEKLYSVAGTVIDDQKTLWSPKLWTPSAQERERLVLWKSSQELLRALKEERTDLSSLSWRQLEDIVAEILRANGLEIHKVRETPQGGRDIIARGELIPGQEPLLMAVEVKHRHTVDRPEVQKALWQNRQLPALLFVTSGRFTAGVLREKALPENQLRLFLKDGEALGDLIRDYRIIN